MNERIQSKRKAKLNFLTSQLDASECNDMSALLAELEKTKAALKQKYSFQQVGVFGNEPVIELEGMRLVEYLLIT